VDGEETTRAGSEKAVRVDSVTVPFPNQRERQIGKGKNRKDVEILRRIAYFKR